jgi:hypothetical protein
MQIVELKLEETKAVVGGTKTATASAPIAVSSNPSIKVPSPAKALSIAAIG